MTENKRVHRYYKDSKNSTLKIVTPCCLSDFCMYQYTDKGNVFNRSQCILCNAEHEFSELITENRERLFMMPRK